MVMYIHWSVCLYALLREVETAAQTQVFYYAKLVSLSQVKLALVNSSFMKVEVSWLLNVI